MTKTQLLENLGFKITNDVTNLIDNYQKEFLTYNSHTNLISKNDEKVLFEKHIYDSLAINIFSPIKNCKKLMDIGTGGGFPSVPIAMLYSQMEVFGVDSIDKKIKFINQIAKTLSLKNLTAQTTRTEDLDAKYKENFDIITSRAVAPLNVILEYAAPYLKTNGYFVAYKSKIVNDEIEQAQNALNVLNCKLEDVINYELPLEENYDRNLVIIKKIKKTPAEYPRRVGLAKSNPL